MRNRIWYELNQAKFNERYSCFLISFYKNILNLFNVVIAVFSTSGVMGWKLWDNLPVISCAIIAFISLAKLVQPHLIPSEKQIEKLDKVSDFYFDFYLQLEKLWFDHENGHINQVDMSERYHNLK